ncbi:FAD dependent oxidoreductase [Mycena crocata]|nr:FAD dependent oxidoreductase [Mycena crocata]
MNNTIHPSLDPGLPCPNPTLSYWTIPPSKLSGCKKDSATIDQEAEVVIIGSGITGVSVARSLLKRNSKIKIVMLEAREVCSGATARNGGHITPAWYHRYGELLETYGKETTEKLIRLQLSHVQELLSVAEEENIVEESQCRMADSFDVYTDPRGFELARKDYLEYMKDLASLTPVTRMYDQKDQFEALQLNPDVAGIIGTVLGAVHPYRLVTGILSSLVKQHANLRLFSFTPCTSIATSSSSYLLSTPKGSIQCQHVVHATNAWASHLLPGFEHKIVSIRGQMSAQRPGSGLGSGSIPKIPSTVAASSTNWQGSRTFVFYPKDKDHAYEYLTQQPQPSTSPTSSTYPKSQSEFMFGGFLLSRPDVFLTQLGNSDDSQTIPEIGSLLSTELPSYFGQHWGDDDPPRPDEEEPKWETGRMKSMWTGLMGFSADGCPWVGRIPFKIAGRKPNSQVPRQGLVEGGEWICAGYSGEGMVNAWKCGEAVAQMMLEDCNYPEWLPDPYVISAERFNNAKYEDLLKEYT